MLTAHAHYIELCLNETAHSANGGTPLASRSSDSMPEFDRIDCMWRSVHAVKFWCRDFLSHPASDYIGMPFHMAQQLVRCMVVLYRLSTYQDSLWDCRAIRNVVDLLQVLDNVTEILHSASIQLNGGRSEDSVLSHMSDLMRAFRYRASLQLSPSEAVVPSEAMLPCEAGNRPEWFHPAANIGIGGNLTPNDEWLATQPFNLFDDGWLDSIVPGWSG